MVAPFVARPPSRALILRRREARAVHTSRATRSLRAAQSHMLPNARKEVTEWPGKARAADARQQPPRWRSRRAPPQTAWSPWAQAGCSRQRPADAGLHQLVCLGRGVEAGAPPRCGSGRLRPMRTGRVPSMSLRRGGVRAAGTSRSCGRSGPGPAGRSARSSWRARGPGPRGPPGRWPPAGSHEPPQVSSRAGTAWRPAASMARSALLLWTGMHGRTSAAAPRSAARASSEMLPTATGSPWRTHGSRRAWS